MKFIVSILMICLFSVFAFTMDMQVYKSPYCGCCNSWIEIMKKSGFNVTQYNVEDINDVKHKANIPQNLASCHTALINGYAIEGHVPADEIKRLISLSPKDVVGLSVAGMPVSSPGMEQGNAQETYNIIAFYKDGTQKVWATYRASKKIN